MIAFTADELLDRFELIPRFFVDGSSFQYDLAQIRGYIDNTLHACVFSVPFMVSCVRVEVFQELKDGNCCAFVHELTLEFATAADLDQFVKSSTPS